MLGCTGLINHVDRLIGQLTVIDITRRQFHRSLDRISSIFDAVMLFEIRFQPLQNFDRIRDRGFFHVNFLEPPRQGAILFKVLTEFFIGRGPHATQLATLQSGF